MFLAGNASAGPPDYKGDCTDAGCHGSLIKFKTVHSPLDGGSCDACHEAISGQVHKFEWTAEPAELCLECHDEFEGKVTHQPVDKGECTSCHNPHGSDHRHLLKAGTERELCTECHDAVLKDMKFLHGPVEDCTACHDPHAANHKALLGETGIAVCTNCHESIEETLADRAFKHAPVTEDCLSCHNPHGGAERFNLTMKPPELCLDCHDSIEEVIEEAAVQHDVVATGRSCLNCHNPHASDFGAMLTGKPMSVCLSCHEKEQPSPSGTLEGLGAVLRDMPHHHGPVADGSCTGCHQPHGGDNFRMLMSEYPVSFYASFEEERYGLCFECHEAEAFETEKTEELTSFRNGNRNLHFLHVNRPKKGRTCRACHNPHASDNPFHINKTARFGKWRLPLNFEQQANGGSCQPGCHKAYRYDRKSPVLNIPKEPAPTPSSN